MSTQKQINANRQNAQKSTGPKTDEGKETVSQNAVKHGLFAQSVIKGENEADYEAFHDKMLAEMKPVGPTEILLAERIVSLWWRLERAERIQNQAFDVMIERDEPTPLQKSLQKWMPKDIGPDTRGAGPELVLGRAIIKDYSYSRVLDRMLMYERLIENSLTKSMRELERRQIIRQFKQREAEQEFDPSPSLRDEAATRKPNQFHLAPSTAGGSISNMKKQTQFSVTHISVKSLKKGDYGKIPLRGAQENKANQSQPQWDTPRGVPFDAPISQEGIGKSDKSISAATG